MAKSKKRVSRKRASRKPAAENKKRELKFERSGSPEIPNEPVPKGNQDYVCYKKPAHMRKGHKKTKYASPFGHALGLTEARRYNKRVLALGGKAGELIPNLPAPKKPKFSKGGKIVSSAAVNPNMKERGSIVSAPKEKKKKKKKMPLEKFDVTKHKRYTYVQILHMSPEEYARNYDSFSPRMKASFNPPGVTD